MAETGNNEIAAGIDIESSANPAIEGLTKTFSSKCDEIRKNNPGFVIGQPFKDKWFRKPISHIGWDTEILGEDLTTKRISKDEKGKVQRTTWGLKDFREGHKTVSRKLEEFEPSGNSWKLLEQDEANIIKNGPSLSTTASRTRINHDTHRKEEIKLPKNSNEAIEEFKKLLEGMPTD